MKNKGLSLVFVLIFLTMKINAHNVNKAYFVIKKDKELQIEAKLPWTFRNELLSTYSDLAAHQTKVKFEEQTFDYFRNNLVLTDAEGLQIVLKKVEKQKSEHHHRVRYLLSFENRMFEKIQNTVLLNSGSEHINYHTFSDDGENPVVFLTNKTKPVYKVETEKTSFNFWLLLVPFPALILLVLKSYKRRKQAKKNPVQH